MNDEDSEVIRYKGGTDENDEPHGRGTLEFASGDKFMGRFQHGMKQGKGCYYFNDGSSLSGFFHSDVLAGPGVYTYDTGGWMEGTYMDGVPYGSAKEYDEDGNLVFSGKYADGVRNGFCMFINGDGGLLCGVVDAAGSASGTNFIYVYPDKHTALIGSFKDGVVEEAVVGYVEVGSDTQMPRITKLVYEGKYKADESTETTISKYPLLSDPYEQQLVYVDMSTMDDAGEGLFSRFDIPADTVVAFYNGIRLSHKTVDARDWSENSNTITLDDDIVIDVPSCYSTTDKYCATLGHKVNHSFDNNSIYDVFQHPRFGPIKCIRSITSISANEEITVFYGYHHEEEGELKAPQWYLDLQHRHADTSKS